MNTHNIVRRPRTPAETFMYWRRRAVALLLTLGLPAGAVAYYQYKEQMKQPAPIEALFSGDKTVSAHDGLTITVPVGGTPLEFRSSPTIDPDGDGSESESDDNIIATLQPGQTLKAPFALQVEGGSTTADSLNETWVEFPYEGGLAFIARNAIQNTPDSLQLASKMVNLTPDNIGKLPVTTIDEAV